MRDYSKVSPQFWIGATGKKLRKAGVEAQLVGLYLLTCSHANMLGLYYLPKVYVSHECGLSLEGASKGLQSCIEAGFCEYDEDAEMVWVYEMALYQIAEQLKPNDNRVAGVQNEYDTLPECQQLLAFYYKYQGNFLMQKQRGIQAPSKPPVSQEQEQEQKTGARARAGTGEGSPAPAPSAPIPETDLQEACRKTWAAYSTAYLNRHGTEPVRNKTVNGQVKAFVQRLGFEESPHVAAFFVQSNSAFYVQRMHSFGNLLADAEKLRTEWVTGKTMTATRARQTDRQQANMGVVEEALALIGDKNAKTS